MMEVKLALDSLNQISEEFPVHRTHKVCPEGLPLKVLEALRKTSSSSLRLGQ